MAQFDGGLDITRLRDLVTTDRSYVGPDSSSFTEHDASRVLEELYKNEIESFIGVLSCGIVLTSAPKSGLRLVADPATEEAILLLKHTAPRSGGEHE